MFLNVIPFHDQFLIHPILMIDYRLHPSMVHQALGILSLKHAEQTIFTLKALIHIQNFPVKSEAILVFE